MENELSVRNRVAVRTYEPALPWGGEVQQSLAKDLRRLADKVSPELRCRIQRLAEKYENIDGCYYELKLSEQQRERLQAEKARVDNDEHIKFLNLALKGTPTRVASFRLTPCHVLVKTGNKRMRLVKLSNIQGEHTGMIALDSDSYTALRNFRLWLANQGNYSWPSGDRQLQALQQDIDFAMAYQEVIQLVCYGCERVGGLWFMDDCAYAADGTEIHPDRNGIFWYGGKGHQFLRNSDQIPVGEDDQTFRMKPSPQMRPDKGLVFDGKDQIALSANVPDDPTAVQRLLGDFICQLNDSYGGHDGAMLIGAATAFFAGPDLFAKYGQFPGLWIMGEKGSGKTYTAKWLMGLHGLTGITSGLGFKTSTPVGIQIALGQYANIPVWGDEFKETELKDPHVIGVIHGGFNREVATKWSADGRIRTIRTSLLITGESACSNAATMSRFITADAAREKRVGTNEEQRRRLERLERHQQFHFVIGRTLLRNRAKFVERVQHHLAQWEESTELTTVEPRARFTYGVSYASFMALNELVQVYTPQHCNDFRLRLIRKTIAESADLSARTDVVQIFEILTNAVSAGVFGWSAAELKRYFKFAPNPKSNPRLSAQQLRDGAQHPYLAWKSGILYFKPGVIVGFVRKWLNSQGLNFPLDQADLRAQLKSKPYFVTSRLDQGHQQKFGAGADKNEYCWAIDLDKFVEQGLLLVDDNIWNQSLYPDGDTSRPRLSSQDWIDPRRGPLFAIVDKLEDKQ